MDTPLPEYELYAIRYAERDAGAATTSLAATRMTPQCQWIISFGQQSERTAAL